MLSFLQPFQSWAGCGNYACTSFRPAQIFEDCGKSYGEVDFRRIYEQPFTLHEIKEIPCGRTIIWNPRCKWKPKFPVFNARELNGLQQRTRSTRLTWPDGVVVEEAGNYDHSTQFTSRSQTSDYESLFMEVTERLQRVSSFLPQIPIHRGYLQFWSLACRYLSNARLPTKPGSSGDGFVILSRSGRCATNMQDLVFQHPLVCRNSPAIRLLLSLKKPHTETCVVLIHLELNPSLRS